MKPTLLELFAGGGLAGIGYRAAGFNPVGAAEYDPAIAEVYRQNHGDHIHVASVCDVDYRPYHGVDLGHVSPVCTNASQANSKGKETEIDLACAEAVCRMLREARPRWFVLENVGGYQHFQSFRNIAAELLRLGYRAKWKVENSANYGVAQTRKRLILRASRDGALAPLEATHCEGGETGGLFGDEGLLPWVGWYAAVEDLLPGLPDSTFADWQLRRLPAHLKSCLVESKNANQAFGDGRREVDEPATTVIAFQSAARRPKAFLTQLQVGAGDNPTVTASEPRHPRRALLIGEQQGRRCGEGRTLQQAEASSPAFTLRAGENGGGDVKAWQETGRVVAMTPRALARFQSVPDSYVLPEKASLACKVIGNGVPCLLMQRVGENFLQ